MKWVNRILVLVCLSLVTVTLSAEKQNGLLGVSVDLGVSIPLPPDGNLFSIAGCSGIDARYSLGSLQALSAGVALHYQLAPMRHADLGSLGSMSVISVEISPGIQHTVGKLVNLSASAGAGYFYAFINSDPSGYATNITLWGRVGIGLHLSTRWLVGLYGEYRSYETLYHVANIGIQTRFFARE